MAMVLVDWHEYETEEHMAIVMAGDTLDTIASRHYDFQTNKYCWDEFRAKVYNDNAKLVANGRMLQPGDNVVIRVMKRK